MGEPRFVVYDPNNGLDYYDTLVEAHEALDDTIDYYRSDAQFDGEWSQSVTECWLAAIVAQPVSHELPLDEEDEEDGAPVEYAVEYDEGRRHVLTLTDEERELLVIQLGRYGATLCVSERLAMVERLLARLGEAR